MEHPRSARMRGPALFAVVLSSVVVLGVMSASLRSRTDVAPSGRSFMSVFDPSVPLMETGMPTTMEEAAHMAGFPIYHPKDLGDPSEVWIGDLGEGMYQVGLRYDGLVVSLVPWPKGSDPAASFETQVQAFGAGYTTRIAGNPARVRPFDPKRDALAVNAVYMEVDGVGVNLYGEKEVAELIRLASNVEG